MKTEEIKDLFNKFESIVCDYNGVECWSARELCNLLGYVQWRNFLTIVGKAKSACENAGMKVEDHFADVSKMVSLGSGSEREIDNMMLTRYACYLIAQNGDSRKPEIAFAQNYFAVQTRRAELDNAPDSRPLADFLPTISIKAKDLAAEMTSVNG